MVCAANIHAAVDEAGRCHNCGHQVGAPRHELTVTIADGHLRFVYDDALVDLLAVGQAAVCRVSHVEPHPSKGGWVADMLPFFRDAGRVDDAVILGQNGVVPYGDQGWRDVVPFTTRADALAAERAWLSTQQGL